MNSPSLACVILAAGRGTRMRSTTPKLLHEACGRPLLGWTLSAVEGLAADPAIVVVPPDSPALEAMLPEWASAAVQRTARGTGDAVAAAGPALGGFEGDVLVLNGDHPLLDADTLRSLVSAHRDAGAAASVLSITRSETIGADFGRIVRAGDGAVEGIVEVRDATPQQRELTEVNSGYYVFAAPLLWAVLERVEAANDQGELYLTDVIGILAREGHTVRAHHHPDATVAKGVNTRADLAEAAAELRRRIAHAHMLAGVTIVDPATTYIDAGVTIEADVVLQPFTTLRGTTHVETGAVVGPHAVVWDTRVGPRVTVGPFCYTRPGTILEAGSHAGRFVEIKNARLGEGAKVPHLSYVGDADVGPRTNIGAGSITANYDGERKQRTVIGADVHGGSDNVFIAPVTIGDRAWTAAGSIITDDVPADALAVARARQKNIEGYAERRRH